MAKITRSVARKWLSDVPEEKQFWCNDGRVIKNLLELEAALKTMGDETFRYHSNETKNDFSTWIKDVIGDESLAESLKSASRLQAVKTVADRIAWIKAR